MTSYSLKAFCFGLIAFMAIKILNAGFFARQDPKTPMYVALISLILNVIFNWLLAFKFGYGHVGLAIGSVIAAIVSFFILSFILIKRSILILEGDSAIFLLKIIISSLSLFIGLVGFQTLLPNFSDLSMLGQIFNLLTIIFFGAFIYFGLMFVFGLRMSFFKN
jgi:putative peptidoglycan lipid II flippase